MARKVYRFKANLTPTAPLPPRERSVMDQRTRLELKWQAQLMGWSPATLEPGEWDDPLSAQEFLAAYNASLKRAQNLEVGLYERDGIDYHVFFSEDGSKNAVTQPHDQRGRRVSQLVVGLDGTITRLSLEATGGVSENLSPCLNAGIARLENETLRGLPGFVLRVAVYSREGQELVEVDQWRRFYDPRSDSVVEVN